MNKYHNWINTGLIVIVLIIGLVGGNQPGPVVGGSTSATWTAANLVSEGTLTVAGATTLTGAISLTGEATTQGLTQGGGCTASTTAVATELWTEADMLGANCFSYGGTGALASVAITITLPASTTMTSLLPNAGNSRLWFYSPKNYAAATTTTFAAGTGIILMEPDGQNVVIAGATSAAWLECVRLPDTDVSCTVDEVIDAD